MSTHIGYNKCKGNRIVKLEIQGENNENRRDVVDAKHAKYRCSQATVLSITSWNEKETFTEATSLTIDQESELVYRVGETITIDDYDIDLNGINYYLDRLTAVQFFKIDKKYTGLREMYWSNGNLWQKIEYVNGEHNGLYERYNLNGQLERKF